MDLRAQKNNISALRRIASNSSDKEELLLIAEGCELTLTALQAVLGSMDRVAHLIKEDEFASKDNLRALSNKIMELAAGYVNLDDDRTDIVL